MTWLRLYTALLDNAKAQSLPPDLFKVWINLLCLARIHDGTLPDIVTTAFRLRCSEEQAQAWIDALTSRKLLDIADGRYRPHEWSEFQYDSDSSTPRVRKFREKRSESKAKQSRDRTDTEQNRAKIVSRNVSETLQQKWQEFKSLYPAHRLDEKDSYEAFLSKTEDADAIIAGLKRALNSGEWSKDNGAYVNKASLFISKGRYFDPWPPQVDDKPACTKDPELDRRLELRRRGEWPPPGLTI